MFGRSHENRRRPRGGTVLHAKLSADASGDAYPVLRRWIIRASVTLTLVASVAVGGWWLRENWINRIPALAIREVIVEVDGVLSPEEVRRLAGVPLGRNILSVDLPNCATGCRTTPGSPRPASSPNFPEAC